LQGCGRVSVMGVLKIGDEKKQGTYGTTEVYWFELDLADRARLYAIGHSLVSNLGDFECNRGLRTQNPSMSAIEMLRQSRAKVGQGKLSWIASHRNRVIGPWRCRYDFAIEPSRCVLRLRFRI